MGIITAEIGLGLRYIALVHIIGHACLRTLQLVRAPTLLHDYHSLENAIGEHLPSDRRFMGRWSPSDLRLGLYRLALERGYLDAMINEYVVRPFVLFFAWCDRLGDASGPTCWPEAIDVRAAVRWLAGSTRNCFDAVARSLARSSWWRCRCLGATGVRGCAIRTRRGGTAWWSAA